MKKLVLKMSSYGIKKPNKMDLLRIILSIFLIFGIILPIIFMLFQINKTDFSKVFNDRSFYKLLFNSFISTIIATILSVLLALTCAYLLDRSSIKKKNIFIIFLTLPMLIPSISHAMGLINLFGKNGFLDKLFGLDVEIYGIIGITLGSIMYSFPVALLLIYDSLKYEDKSIYDVTETLGISKISSFFKITIPYLKKVLISTFFAVFTMIFTDYGVPLAIGGKFTTLPVFLYQEVINRMNFSKGAIIGIILLIPALIAFIYDILTKEDNTVEIRKGVIKRGKLFNAITIILLSLISILLIFPQFSFLITAFVKSFPNNMNFSLEHLQYTIKRGLLNNYFASLKISFLTAFIGMIMAYMTAYLSTRIGGKVGKALNFVAIVTMAVPGMALGLGYIFLFKGTFIYGTLAILVLVNIIHFFASPYILAKNAFIKLDKNFESIGSTLGIGRLSILFKVLIPNTKSTLFEMFSYFFVNSMITISAVSFLYSIGNKPLSLLIPQFESQLSYEAAGIVSLLILFTNIIFKIFLNIVKKLSNRKDKDRKMLTRYQFDFLTYLEKKGSMEYTQRKLSDALTLSLGTVNKILNDYLEKGVIEEDENKNIKITKKGLDLLQPYKVSKAIIIAAGFGSRLVPVTIQTPKPLVKINGVRIIDTLIDALVEADIKDITIVRGYKKEKFDELLLKYPFIKFIDNDSYNVSNNISSVYVAKDIIDNCYICEADLVISNKNVITKYQYSSNYLGAYVKETDDWCFYKTNGYISKMSIGGENCYHMIGISYWNAEDSQRLVKDITTVFKSRGGKENYWDNVPLKICKKNYKLEVRECKKSDVTEIDTFNELKIIDSSYENYPTEF